MARRPGPPDVPAEPGATPSAPTMRDVASAAGVSKALVSIVFRGAAGASDETRARVFAAAERIGYRTNRTASLLALRRNKHLGLTMSVRNAFHAELVEGLQAAADEAGYELVLSTVAPGHDERRAVETLLEFRCEALILLGSDLPRADLAELATARPVVVVGRRLALDAVEVVRTADDRGLEAVVDHLVRLGHRQIVHVDGGRGTISADRRRGYLRAMRRHGLSATTRVLRGGSEESDGRRAAEEMVRGSLPTAVTAFNDHCALGVLDRLTRAGVSVPGAVSVTGYDNSLVAQLAAVDLTSVSQEAAVQARWAVQAAVQRLEGARSRPEEVVLQPRLVTRGSTAPPPS
jgi:DNA-binding LacI/PurR family transcriptional regulator